MTWRRHLTALGVVELAIIILFRTDVLAMADKWWNISTYGHCLFLPFIIAWLVWERRDEVKPVAPAAWLPGLIGVAAAAFLWVLGEAGDISLFRHASVIFMLQASTVAILGPNASRALMFPIFYAVFMIPFGEESMPVMQTITAKMSMAMLGWSNVPAHIEGVYIWIPTGLFKVAEACSGVKFLVAMAAFSALAANLCFNSWRRRLAFLLMAMIVPIFANGFRAFSTIYISWLSGNTDFAASIDHIIYGWVFFALVMALVMAIGWRFFDRKATDPFLFGKHFNWSGRAVAPHWGAVGTLTVIVGTMLLQSATSAMGRHPMPQQVALPEVAGWARTAANMNPHWGARFQGADHWLEGSYADAEGDRVDVIIALFAWQDQDRKMLGFGQGGFGEHNGWSWVNGTTPPSNGRADRLFALGTERELASFYHVGGKTMGGGSAVKLKTLETRLLGQDQAAAVLLVSAEKRPDRAARPQVDAFLNSLGSVDGVMEKMIIMAKGRS